MTPDSLSDAERALKLACERAIHDNLNTFVAVGEALQTIRDQRLYRADYATFADYCRTMWTMSVRRANQLRAAAQVVVELTGTTGSDLSPAALPANERQARALLEFDTDLRPAIWKIALRTAEALQRPLTAALVTQVGRPLQLAADTGAVDTGDGESTVLTAAVTQDMYETAARQAQHLRDRQNRVTVQGQVFTVTDDPSGYYRIAVRADQPGAEKLHNLQLVSVTFTPQQKENESDVKQEMRHG